MNRRCKKRNNFAYSYNIFWQSLATSTATTTTQKDGFPPSLMSFSLSYIQNTTYAHTINPVPSILSLVVIHLNCFFLRMEESSVKKEREKCISFTNTSKQSTYENLFSFIQMPSTLTNLFVSNLCFFSHEFFSALNRKNMCFDGNYRKLKVKEMLEYKIWKRITMTWKANYYQR